jgi:predicted amidohydrolase
MNIILAQITPKLSRANEALHVNLVRAYEDQCEVIIFPELSLNGYLLKDAVFEDAYTRKEIEGLPFLNANCDVVFGCAYKEEHKIYNAAVYATSSGELYIHKKTQLPNYGLFQEARFFFSGVGIELFQTKLGKCALVVCEELFDASTVATLAKLNPDVILVLSNSPARGFEEKLAIQETWKSLLCACAIYSRAHVLFVNRVGFEDGLGFWGGSCHVSPQGVVLNEAPLFEEHLLHVKMKKNLGDVSKYFLRHI